MDYSFNTDVAVAVGVEAAVIFQNIAFWCKKNAANEKHFHDGNYWTYNSRRAWHDLFPFFTERKVSRLLQKLKEAGLIEVGNYNAIGYDRTLWYAVTPKGWKLLKQDVPPFLMVEKSVTTPLDKNGKCNDQNCQLHGTELTNRLDESVPPIPDINTDINKEEEEEEAGWQEVVKCYQNNIRPICGEMERDELLSLYQDYGKEWVIASIHESVKNDVRKRSYMKAVLERWKVDGFGVDSRKKKDSQPSKKKASYPTEDDFAKARAEMERRMKDAGEIQDL
jgi:DNA-binding PadR family transcriptional regulator